MRLPTKILSIVFAVALCMPVFGQTCRMVNGRMVCSGKSETIFPVFPRKTVTRSRTVELSSCPPVVRISGTIPTVVACESSPVTITQSTPVTTWSTPRRQVSYQTTSACVNGNCSSSRTRTVSVKRIKLFPLLPWRR